MMEKLTIKLNNVKDTYYGFVAAVLTYVKKKPSRQKKSRPSWTIIRKP